MEDAEDHCYRRGTTKDQIMFTPGATGEQEGLGYPDRDRDREKQRTKASKVEGRRQVRSPGWRAEVPKGLLSVLPSDISFERKE
jgi:hypothetical protein